MGFVGYMVDCSNAHVYLNTYPLEQRTLVEKSTKELQRMTDFDSTDVFDSILLDHYVQRPDKLENDCLADFAAWYNFTKKNPRKYNKTNVVDSDLSK